jgi:hypothetical protein
MKDELMPTITPYKTDEARTEQEQGDGFGHRRRGVRVASKIKLVDSRLLFKRR